MTEHQCAQEAPSVANPRKSTFLGLRADSCTATQCPSCDTSHRIPQPPCWGFGQPCSVPRFPSRSPELPVRAGVQDELGSHGEMVCAGRAACDPVVPCTGTQALAQPYPEPASSGTARGHSVGTEPQHSEDHSQVAGWTPLFSSEAQGIPWRSGALVLGLSLQQLCWAHRIHRTEDRVTRV